MLKNHRQIVEEHFNRCLKEHGLTPQEAIIIARTSKNYDPRLCKAVSDFLGSNLYSVDISTVASLLPVGRNKASNFINFR